MSRSDAFVGSVSPRGIGVAGGPPSMHLGKKSENKSTANPVRVARADNSISLSRFGVVRRNFGQRHSLSFFSHNTVSFARNSCVCLSALASPGGQRVSKWLPCWCSDADPEKWFPERVPFYQRGPPFWRQQTQGLHMHTTDETPNESIKHACCLTHLNLTTVSRTWKITYSSTTGFSIVICSTFGFYIVICSTFGKHAKTQYGLGSCFCVFLRLVRVRGGDLDTENALQRQRFEHVLGFPDPFCENVTHSCMLLAVWAAIFLMAERTISYENGDQSCDLSAHMCCVWCVA